jgi:plasmid replication initiation protein
MLPYLTQLKQQFTMFELSTVLALKSKYAKRLYMFASQFRATKMFTISMEELRKRLRLEDKYQTFADFNKRVIVPALNEINLLSELNMELTSKDRGTYAIEALRFHVAQKQTTEEVTGNEKQIRFMIAVGLSNWQVENVLMQRTPDELAPILRRMYLRKVDKHAKHIANPGAWAVKCLQNEGIDLNSPMPKQLRIA